MEEIKIVLLKSRQQIICKISELMAEDSGDPLCFLFEAPLVISYGYENAGSNEDVKIVFQQWSPFSSSLQFRVPFDYVVTIGEPKEEILQKYIEVVKPYYPIINDVEPIKSTEEE